MVEQLWFRVVLLTKECCGCSAVHALWQDDENARREGQRRSEGEPRHNLGRRSGEYFDHLDLPACCRTPLPLPTSVPLLEALLCVLTSGGVDGALTWVFASSA
jgi:hypothetical protein